MNNKVKVALGLFLVTDIAIAYVGYQMYNNMLKTEKNVKDIIASIDKELPKSVTSTNVYHSGFLNSSGEYSVVDNKSKNTVKIKYAIDHGFKTLLNKKTFVKSSLSLAGDMSKVIKPVGDALFNIDGEVGENGIIDVTLLSKGFTVDNVNKRMGKIVFGSSGGKLYHDNHNKLVHDYEISKIELLSDKPHSSATFTGVGYKLNTPNWKGIIGNVEFIIKTASVAGMEAKNIKMHYKAEDVQGKYDIASGLGVENAQFRGDDGSFKMGFSYKGLEKSPIDYFNNEIINHKVEVNGVNVNFKDEYKNQLLVLIQKGFTVSLDNLELESKNLNVSLKSKIEIHPANSIKEISLEDNLKIIVNTKASGPIVDSMLPMVVGMAGQEPVRYTDGSYKYNAQYEDHKFFIDNKENVNAGIQIRQALRNLDIALGFDRQLPPLVPAIEIPLENEFADPALEGLPSEGSIRAIQ